MASEGAAVELTADHLDDILELERASWAPELCASEQTVRERFERGHRMFGVYRDGRLAAKIAFAYAQFDPSDQVRFPSTFREFATQSRPEHFNACFIYNLDIRPDRRALGYAAVLIRHALRVSQQDGCVYAVGDARPSSYNGGESEVERVEYQPRVRAALDAYAESGELPDLEDLLQDRTVALYRRLTGAEIWSIRAGFLPEDRAAGGFRVIIVSRVDAALAHLDR